MQGQCDSSVCFFECLDYFYINILLCIPTPFSLPSPNTAELLFPKVSMIPLTGKPEASRILQNLTRIPLIDTHSAIISQAFYTPVPLLLLLLLLSYSKSTLACTSHTLFDELPSISA